MKRERRFSSNRKMASYSLAGRGRPGNTPTAPACSSARRHDSEHVAPSARIMLSPFEPVTTQT
jgi:hypothetical protein